MSNNLQIKTVQYNGVEYIKLSDVPRILLLWTESDLTLDKSTVQKLIVKIVQTQNENPVSVKSIQL